MKLNIVRDLEKGIYSVDVKSVVLDETEKELIKDAEPQKLDIAGDIVKTTIENIITKVSIVDADNKPVLDANDNPTYNDVTVHTEKEEVLLRLGSKYKVFPFDIPFSRSFSSAEFGDKTQTIAEAYAETIEKRIEKIMTNLRAKPDTFSKDDEIII